MACWVWKTDEPSPTPDNGPFGPDNHEPRQPRAVRSNRPKGPAVPPARPSGPGRTPNENHRPNGPTIRHRPERTPTGRSGKRATQRRQPIPIPLAQREHRAAPARPTPEAVPERAGEHD